MQCIKLDTAEIREVQDELIKLYMGLRIAGQALTAIREVTEGACTEAEAFLTAGIRDHGALYKTYWKIQDHFED